jgi:CBS domain-containing protein
MNVGALIRRKPETLPPSATCAEAACLMRDARVGSVVIAEQGRPLGMLTDRDLVLRVVAEGKRPEKISVGEVMTERPIFVADSCDLVAALQLMSDLAVRRVPIIDDKRTVIGVVSLDDVILALAKNLGAVAELIRKET